MTPDPTVSIRRAGIAATVLDTIGVVAAACSTPAVPPGVWATNYGVSAGHMPNADQRLVPLAQMVANNITWGKEASPNDSLCPIKGAALRPAPTSHS